MTEETIYILKVIAFYSTLMLITSIFLAIPFWKEIKSRFDYHKGL